MLRLCILVAAISVAGEQAPRSFEAASIKLHPSPMLRMGVWRSCPRGRASRRNYHVRL